MKDMWKSGVLATLLLALISAPAIAQTVTAKQLWMYVSSDGRRFHMTVDEYERHEIEKYRDDWKGNASASVMAFASPARGLVPVYRYLNKKSGDHFFTTDKGEGDAAVSKYGYSSESLCCYIAPVQMGGTIPLYRLQKSGIHRYVFSRDEQSQLTIKEGWTPEGITGYVWPLSFDHIPSLPVR